MTGVPASSVFSSKLEIFIITTELTTKMTRLFIILLLFASCSLPKYPRKWIRKGIVPNERELTIHLGTKGKALKVLYTGCGGLTVDNGEEAISTDPYFSNQPFLNIQLGKIRTIPASVEEGLSYFKETGLDAKRIKHVLIAHSHYDHLMDVPYLLERQAFHDSVKVYGGTTTKNMIKNYLPSDSTFFNLEPKTYYRKNEFIKTGQWIALSERVRVLPIEAEHAPHFLNVEMMHGEVGAEGVDGLSKSTSKTKATDWKRGKVFSFLIDFMNKDEIELRIFIQSSSCQPPLGIPPKDELEKRKVDIAFIGVASTQNVKDYPISLLKETNPRQLVLIHWEDFFRPYGAKSKTVRFTNFNKFFKRIEKFPQAYQVIMPHPGDVLKLSY